MKEIGSGRLDDRVAIVTGAGQGGGMGAALALAGKGAHLVLVGRTLSKLEKIAAEIAAMDGAGGKAICLSADVTSPTDRQKMIDSAIGAFGRIDILVCAAQSPEQRDMPMLDTTLEMANELWDSGFIATYELMRLCHPHMKAAGGGSIINFGSGTQTNPGQYSAYAGVKAAINAMSRAAATEWGKDNIRVNVVLPMVKSPAFDLHFENHPGTEAEIAKRLPLGRLGEAEDIGRPVAFLACDESRYITGTTLSLDGGSTFLR